MYYPNLKSPEILALKELAKNSPNTVFKATLPLRDYKLSKEFFGYYVNDTFYFGRVHDGDTQESLEEGMERARAGKISYIN